MASGTSERLERDNRSDPVATPLAPPIFAAACCPKTTRRVGRLRRWPALRAWLRCFYRLLAPCLPNPPWATAAGYLIFLRDLVRYRRMKGAERLRWCDLYPCLFDRRPTTPLDLNYFLQDTWAAAKVFQYRPSLHVDVGSTALLVGILAQFTRVCSVDIRPLPVELPGLEVKRGSILEMPFEDRSLRSISSLCVVEHIGLGRYGDPLDPQGSRRAAAELQRVLAPGGNLYISVPIDREPKVYFNAHRSFRHNDVLEMFDELAPAEIKFIQWGNTYDLEDINNIPFGEQEVVGLYHFRRQITGHL
ncbi:MAG: hypothetical protein KatS3mg110_1719 [Pirellulaceae bacterium]|nr:MAG: hypothetical protein KatS3mg110_1719 [Pirellulaceae bacterium]